MLPWILFVVFVVVQTIAFVFVWIIRYHFKQFSVPDDPRGLAIVRTMTVGTIVLFFAAGVVLISFLVPSS